MTGLGSSIKAGVQGVKGAGDAIRGTALQAADEAFDKNPTDPQTAAAHAKNRNIAESGKADVRAADERIGERERSKLGMPSSSSSSAGESGVAGSGIGGGGGGVGVGEGNGDKVTTTTTTTRTTTETTPGGR